MKFITKHPRTIQTLATWSAPERALVVSHFFWNAGTSMQKSLQGLLRTLLYDIFRQLPELIGLVCVERLIRSEEQLEDQLWHVSELEQALQRIASQDRLPAKFCLFIDGLDEYDGDHADICKTLRDLSCSKYIKVCIASRPWNAFEDSFGRQDSSKLYVHELTRKDIRRYTADRLQKHPRWSIMTIEVKDAEYLLDEITDRATGVFLWVYLVTRELRRGLDEYDCFEDIQRRLERIPTELAAFFKQILDSVDPFYHEKMATTLAIALAAHEPAPIAIYYFHNIEYQDGEYALKLPVRAITDQQARSRIDQTTRQLNGRCRGLLEVNTLGGSVDFLHRTVKDHLRTPEMIKYLKEKTPAHANASLSLLRAFVAHIKSSIFLDPVARIGFGDYTEKKIVSTLQETLSHARELGKSRAAFMALGELDRCIEKIFRDGQARFDDEATAKVKCDMPTTMFRELVFEALLVDYLSDILPGHPTYFPECLESPMSRIMSMLFKNSLPSEEQALQLKVFKCLLKNGFGPNTHVSHMTVWLLFLQHVFGSWTSSTFTVSLKGMFLSMLKHGADPNVIIYPWGLGSAAAWIAFATVSALFSLEARYESLYLQVLDEFIAASADIRGKSSSSDSSKRPEKLSSLPSVTKLCRLICKPCSLPWGSFGLACFFGFIAEIRKTKSFVTDHSLLTKVTVRLLSATGDARAGLDHYQPLIEKAFPVGLQLQVTVQISENLSPHSSRSLFNFELPRKRDLEDDNDQSNSKRSKLVEPNVINGQAASNAHAGQRSYFSANVSRRPDAEELSSTNYRHVPEQRGPVSEIGSQDQASTAGTEAVESIQSFPISVPISMLIE